MAITQSIPNTTVPKGKISTEATALIALALPIAISQISRVGISVVDTIFAGNVSSEGLAAVGLGSAIWFAIFFFVSGALLVASPLIGSRKKVDDPALLNRTVEQVWLTGMFWGVVSSVILVGAAFLTGMAGLDPSVSNIVRDYLLIIALGAPASALFQSLKFSFDAMHQPGRGMRIGLFGFLVNIPLNYVLIFGAFGFEGMGVIGCAWATTFTYWLMLFALMASEHYTAIIPGQEFRLISKPNAEDQRYLLTKGLPSGITIVLDAGFFSVLAWLAINFGAVTVAANQIAINFVSLMFVGQIALSMAISIRVSQGENAESMARTAWTGTGISCTLSCIYIMILMIFGMEIVSIYSADPEVRGIALGLLSVAILFLFIDSIQICVAGALRGMHDTFFPMLIVGTAYWLVALPVSIILIYTDLITASATIYDVWYGLAIGIAIAAIMLGARLLQKTKFRSPPASEVLDQ